MLIEFEGPAQEASLKLRPPAPSWNRGVDRSSCGSPWSTPPITTDHVDPRRATRVWQTTALSLSCPPIRFTLTRDVDEGAV